MGSPKQETIGRESVHSRGKGISHVLLPRALPLPVRRRGSAAFPFFKLQGMRDVLFSPVQCILCSS
jgi:hypothetical protein